MKEIMRGMIVEQSHLPTADDVQRERESFAKQIAVFESRIDALEEENRRLKENQQVDNNQQDSKQTEDIPSVSDEHNQSSSVF